MLAKTTLPILAQKQILRASQSGGPNSKDAQERVVEVFGGKLKKITSWTCRRYNLREQEQQDVLAETYQQLFNPEIARFAARRGRPEHYFTGLVRNAARKTMAQLGVRRRQTVATNCESEDEQKHVVTQRGNTVVKRYRIPQRSRSPAEDVEMRDTVAFILGQATPRVRRALELAYWEGWPLQSIAKQLRVSRFALARELCAFFLAIRPLLGGE